MLVLLTLRTRKNHRWLFTQMKLLLDQNLSDQLVVLLADLFPNSTHVKTIGLDTATDTELWNYARDNDYFIVSKDADFRNRSVVHGYPPKVIWVRIGNCSTSTVEYNLRKYFTDIKEFAMDGSVGLFVLW